MIRPVPTTWLVFAVPIQFPSLDFLWPDVGVSIQAVEKNHKGPPDPSRTSSADASPLREMRHGWGWSTPTPHKRETMGFDCWENEGLVGAEIF